jgi:uncharacterized protein YwgA
MKRKNNGLRFSNNLKSAILVYIVGKYKEVGPIKLGRTIMQKICYFLKFVDIPLPYSFQLHNYGPFSQPLLSDMEFLYVDGLIEDRSNDSDFSDYQITQEGEKFLKGFENKLNPLKTNIDAIVGLVCRLDAEGMELFSTTHYIFWAYKNWNQRNPSKKEVVDRVYEIKKEKFRKDQIESAFEQMKKVGMIG